MVVPGDSLWAIAQQYYGDPYLWPTIWDANRWITYSHWIYPGDPIVIPGRPTVVSEAPPPPTEPVPEPWTPPPPAPAKPAPPPAPPSGPTMIPAASQIEMLCAPQLASGIDSAADTIFAREEPDKTLLGTGDIVYVRGGAAHGMTPGQRFIVKRDDGKVYDPARREEHARFIRNLGWLRIIAVQEESATAEIEVSCDAMQVGDAVVPMTPVPVPMVEVVPLKAISGITEGTEGQVLVSFDPRATINGAGHFVGVDLGNGAGATVGDRVLFWRPGENGAPRRVLAQGIVIATGEMGSTVKLMESVVEVRIGDRAQLL